MQFMKRMTQPEFIETTAAYVTDGLSLKEPHAVPSFNGEWAYAHVRRPYGTAK